MPKIVVAGRARDIRYASPLTGATITLEKGCPRLVLTPAGTIATLAVVLPYLPSDGDLVVLSSTQEVTALTVTAPAGATVQGGVAGLGPSGAVGWVYKVANTTWYVHQS